MDISLTPALEAIARVLAAQRLSANARVQQPSAASDVDDAWPDCRDDAIAVLKTLRKPDVAMAEAGDARIWERMILAPLGQATPAEPGDDDLLPAGTMV